MRAYEKIYRVGPSVMLQLDAMETILKTTSMLFVIKQRCVTPLFMERHKNARRGFRPI